MILSLLTGSLKLPVHQQWALQEFDYRQGLRSWELRMLNAGKLGSSGRFE